MIKTESTPLEDFDTGKIGRQCLYIKFKVLDGHKAEEINVTFETASDEQGIVFTDKTSYVDIADFEELHITEKSDKETTKETLK